MNNEIYSHWLIQVYCASSYLEPHRIGRLALVKVVSKGGA